MRKTARIITAVLLTACFAVTLTVGKTKLSKKDAEALPAGYRGVITLWHIDTFEGGVGSRRQFLQSVAREFEKTQSGVFVWATEYTKESAERAFSAGEYPDMVSYGAGVNVCGLKELKPDLYCSSGAIDGRVYAVPWCRGGYCFIENPDYRKSKSHKSDILISRGENTLSSVALALSGKAVKNAFSDIPFNAYYSFVNGESGTLFGTQRDINRLISRGAEFTVRPVTEFSDLFQYISVTATDTEKAELCNGFIDLLTSEKTQTSLYKIGMLSCYYKVPYTDPELAEMQKAEIIYTVSAFADGEKRAALCDLGDEYLAGITDSAEKIKKLPTMCRVCLEKK